MADRKPSGFGRISSILLTLALSLLLLAGSGYLLRDPLLLASLRLALFDYGIALHDMQGVHLSTSSIHIASLSLSLPGASTRSSVENLHITFTPRALLEGQLEAVHVARVMLHPADADADAQSDSPFVLPEAAPIVTAMTQFPIARIAIDSLSFAPWLDEATFSLLRAPRELTAAIDAA